MEGRRLLSAGDPDPTFGAGTGRVVTDFGATVFGRPAAALAGDGRLLVGGSIGGDFAVARYAADGTPDRGFGGGDGLATIDFGLDVGLVRDLAALPGGKVLAVGTRSHDGSGGGDLVAAPEGTAEVTGPLPHLGRIETYFVVARFNADGTPDTTFGTGGQLDLPPVEADDFAHSLAVQPDGRFLVGGMVLQSGRGILMRFNANGTPDASFGQGGTLFEPDAGPAFDEGARSFTVKALPGGKILAGARLNATDDLALFRYNPDGSRDPTFGGGDGIASANFGGTPDLPVISWVQDLALQPDGKVVATGRAIDYTAVLAPDFSDVILARFNADGTLDPTFGPAHDGKVKADLNDTASGAAVAVAAGGRILVALGGDGFAVAAYRPDGTPDPTFGPGGADGDGIATLAFPAGASSSGLLLQPDGKAVVVGTSGGNFALARLLGDPPPVNQPLAVTGTAGNDRIAVTRSADGKSLVVTVNGATTAMPAAGVTAIVLRGLAANDTLDVANNITMPATLDGGPGSDLLKGGGGDDTLLGGDGDDVLDGRRGGDVFWGGAGRDAADYASRSKNVSVGPGKLPDDGEAGEGDNVRADVEDVYGGKGNDFLNGSAADNRLFGGPGNDVLVGNGGRDTLSGGAGNDRLVSRDAAADRLLDGGAGVDSLRRDDALDRSVTGIEQILA